AVPRLVLSDPADHLLRDHGLDDDLSVEIKDDRIDCRCCYRGSRLPSLLLRRPTRQCCLMRKLPTGKIIFSTLSIFILLLSLLVNAKLPWQRDTPRPAQTTGPAPAPPRVQVQSGLPSPDDTARFLAGMPIPKDSPLAPLTNDPAWQEHAANFEKAFANL